jgi:hypothetical protein
LRAIVFIEAKALGSHEKNGYARKASSVNLKLLGLWFAKA